MKNLEILESGFSVDFAEKFIHEKERNAQRKIILKAKLQFNLFCLDYEIFAEVEKPCINFQLELKNKEDLVIQREVLNRLNFLYKNDLFPMDKITSFSVSSKVKLANSLANSKDILNEFFDIIERTKTILNFHFASSFAHEIYPKDNLTAEERRILAIEKRYNLFRTEPTLQKRKFYKKKKNLVQTGYVLLKKLGIIR